MNSKQPGCLQFKSHPLTRRPSSHFLHCSLKVLGLDSDTVPSQVGLSLVTRDESIDATATAINADQLATDQ